MTIPVYYRVENIVGKGENTGYQQFFFFPQFFQKAFFSGSLKKLPYLTLFTIQQSANISSSISTKPSDNINDQQISDKFDYG